MKFILNLFSKVLHAHQYLVANFLKKSSAKYRIICCGRTYGKSFLLKEILKEKANIPNQKIFFISQTYTMSGIFYADIFECFDNAKFVKTRKRGRWIELNNGTRIEFYSYDRFDNLRGFNHGNYIFLDEAAKLPNRGWDEVISYVCDNTGVKEVYLCSTPKGKNWFYWVANKSSSNPSYVLIKASSYDNPLLTKDAKERLDLMIGSDLHKQETLAEFIEDGGEVFKNVSEAFTLLELAKSEKNRYYGGVDIARDNDFTVITVLNEKKELCYFRRFNQADFEIIANEINFVLKKFKCKIAIERNNQGVTVLKILKSIAKNDYFLVKEFETQGNRGGVEGSKSIIINDLILAFQIKEIKLLRKENNKNMRDIEFELESFEQKNLSSGMQYGASGGAHDDTVISLALANYMVNQSRPNKI